MINDILHSTENKADVSINHDLAIGIMNLIAIEEHLFFTGAKTEKTQYYDMINEIRDMRKELLKKIIKEYEGEIWCTSKHLLTASMRMMEVGTKEQTLGNNSEAYSFFEKSYNLYMMFWSLNMNQQNFNKDKIEKNEQTEDIKHFTDKIDKIKAFLNNKETLNVSKTSLKLDNQIDNSKFSLSKLKKFIAEKLDCCRE